MWRNLAICGTDWLQPLKLKTSGVFPYSILLSIVEEIFRSIFYSSFFFRDVPHDISGVSQTNKEMNNSYRWNS